MSKHTSCWRQTGFVVTGEGVRFHTFFPLLAHLSTAGGVQPISVANPFLNVFISTCRLCFREEKNLEPCQALSRNSGKGNGIVK